MYSYEEMITFSDDAIRQICKTRLGGRELMESYEALSTYFLDAATKVEQQAEHTFDRASFYELMTLCQEYINKKKALNPIGDKCIKYSIEAKENGLW